MRFNLVRKKTFLDILSDVYGLTVYANEGIEDARFFRSLNPLARKLAFNLPMGFYETSEQLRDRWTNGQWEALKKKSLESGVNYSISVLGDAGLGGGVHVAHNPVLSLRGCTHHKQRYKRHHIKNLNTEYNKADRNRIEIVFATTEDELRGFYHVLACQYVREHMMVFQPFELYRRLFAQDFGQLLVAKQDGKVVGGMFLMRDDKVLHYNWGARARIGNVSIGTILIDAAIEHALSAGYDYFDFGSTPLSDDALLRFKLKWGAIDEPVYKYSTLQNQGIMDLNTAYMWPRKLFSFLPIAVAKKLMPIAVPWVVSG
ncbi:GNAT family N-acetyltransferase [uncultured Hoeflea sp.]|uniref:GNAT family N-acetyltransferase n=1 Tax=uncultured Hoeflea sp. TaxID=538666 RepID=UPI002613595E|nr:GNAT family N-acetyltransferase [uncultured Hoeflea sp.]